MDVLESLHSAMQRGGMPTLVNILHQLLAEQNLMPKQSTSEAVEDPTTQEATGGDATKSTDWQPLGIQVAHTLMALCIYPQSSQSTSFPHSGLARNTSGKNGGLNISSDVPHHQSKDRDQVMAQKRTSLSHTPLAMVLEKCIDEQASRDSRSKPKTARSKASSGVISRNYSGEPKLQHQFKERGGGVSNVDTLENKSASPRLHVPGTPSWSIKSNSNKGWIMATENLINDDQSAIQPTNAWARNSEEDSCNNNSMMVESFNGDASFHGRRLVEDSTKGDKDDEANNFDCHSSQSSEANLKARRSVDVNMTMSKLKYLTSMKNMKESKNTVNDEVKMRDLNIKNLADNKEKQMEDEMRNKETPPVWWLLHPASTTHWFWDVFMTINLIYVLLFAPINVCFTTRIFQYPNWGWAVDFSVNLFFCVDIIVNFITGVYIEDDDDEEPDRGSVASHKSMLSLKIGDIRKHSFSSNLSDTMEENERFFKKDMRLSYALKDIWLEYITSWFVIDVLTVLPWDILLVNLVNDNMDVGAASKLAKLMRLARLIKLLKLHRLRKFMSFLHRNIPLTVLELTKMFLGMCIVSHYVACGFFFVALMTNETGEGTWLEAYLAVPNAIDTFAASDLYLNSIYWGFTTVTSVGYGDILPVTNAEKAYALFVMYTGLGMMSAITGKLTAVLAKFNAKEALMQAHISSVKSYCQYRELPREIRANVLQYFEVRAAQKAVCDEQAILRDMSPSLKAQVVCYIFDEVIQSVPFFRGCSDLFLSEVLCCMEPVLFAPADIIILKGQRELAMYVISKGSAAVVSIYGKIIRELSEGTSVGEIGLLFGVRRTATVCSITFCDTFKLVQESFLEVQKMYPEMQQIIEEQAEKMFNENMCCFICGKVGHVCIQCPEFATHPANSMHDTHVNTRLRRQSSTASVKAWIRNSILLNKVNETQE